ncbi:MAG: hypothetical protein HKN70_07455, partial [Gammaproteobacteria bacterium]|nr:hypothetical protein [Gammaproteobacteria bacterium]
VLDANIEYKGEAYRIDASLSRSVSPVGLGFLIESTELSVRGDYRLSETLTARISLSAYDNEAVDSSVQFAREGIRIQPWVSWRVSEQWKLDGGVRYRTRDSLNTVESEGFNVFVGATYNFKPWTASR